MVLPTQPPMTMYLRIRLHIWLCFITLINEIPDLKERAVAGKPSVTRLTHSRYSLEHHGRLLAPVVTLPINFPGGALALVLYVHVHGLVDLHLIVLLVLEILHIPGGTSSSGRTTLPALRPVSSDWQLPCTAPWSR